MGALGEACPANPSGGSGGLGDRGPMGERGTPFESGILGNEPDCSSLLNDYNTATSFGGGSVSDEVPTSVRLPREFVKRLDALVPRLEKVPTFAALGPLTRSKVLRLALARGIEVLEAEHGKGRSR